MPLRNIRGPLESPVPMALKIRKKISGQIVLLLEILNFKTCQSDNSQSTEYVPISTIILVFHFFLVKWQKSVHFLLDTFPTYLEIVRK